MFCTYCGKKIEDNAHYCPQCGAKVEKEYDYSSQSATKDDNNYTEPQQKKPAKVWSVFAKVGKIIGIVTISTCWIPWAAAIIGIYGVVFSALGSKATDEESIQNKKKGLTYSIVGGAISLTLFIAVTIASAIIAANNL